MKNNAEKKKASLGIKIGTIICILLIVLLVFITVKINLATAEYKKEPNPKQNNLQEDNKDTQKNYEERKGTALEEETEGDGKEPDEEIIEEKPEESVNQPPAEAKPDGEAPVVTKNPKPILTPQPLSSEQLFSAFNNTLIIGDSRIEGFKLYSGVKNASYFCMKAMTIDKIVAGKQINIGGSSVSVHDLLDSGSYDKVIIGVGLNELGWNHIETFLSEYGKLIDNIKEKQPNAKIYLQAVLPVSREKNSSDKVHNNAQIYWYNENIISLAEEKAVTFVNPAAALVDEEGFLVHGASTDGVHLTSEYCKIWANYLAELI